MAALVITGILDGSEPAVETDLGDVWFRPVTGGYMGYIPVTYNAEGGPHTLTVTCGKMCIRDRDETTYYAPQDGGRITLTIAQPVADCETAFVVQGMQYTATSPLDAMSEEELSAMSAHDRRSLQKQYAHFWRKDSVYLRLLSNIGEGRICLLYTSRCV